MELYLFLTLLIMYAVMHFLVDKKTMERVWLLSFAVAFFMTGISIAFLRTQHQDALMSVDQMNWYFILYLFGYIAMATGIINLWIYRREIYKILKKDGNEDDPV